MKYLKLIILALIFGGLNLQAQENKCFKDINNHVWANFTKSFEELDYTLFESLHAHDFIRASGSSKSLKNKEIYIDGYKKRWENSNTKQTISFRFLERFCNNTTASERGIYKLTINPYMPTEKSFYGQFHVILVKTKDEWKLLVDYDSNENNTINEDSYNNAFALDDYEKF